MKKLLALLVFGGFITACNNDASTDKATAGDSAAIQTPAAPSTDTATTTAAPVVKDSLMQFKDGKVLISIAGTWSPLSATVTTTNGRKVNPNGEVSKGAIKRKLEEGMMIDKDGQMTGKDGKPLDNTGWE